MDVALWSKISCDAEIFRLFSDLIPLEAVGPGGELEDIRGRQGKVPDLRLRLPAHEDGHTHLDGGGGTTDTLAEIKVCNAGVSRYPRGGDAGREKAVDRRAKGLQTEYEAKLKKLDTQLHKIPHERTGPLVQRLRSYPRLQGYVVGSFSEASEDLHKLVNLCAESRGKYLAQSSGYATSSREMSQIVGQVRRKLSTAFIRAIGLCTLNRVTNTGSNSQAAAKRREWVIREEIQMKKERKAYWSAFVLGGGLKNPSAHFFST